jgi:DNA polymerase-4
VSRQIRDVFEEYTPLVEPLSLDEAYLDVTGNLKGIPTAVQVAREIRARILVETSLTASAGVSYNKFLAKLASDQRKPNGQFVITPEMGPAFVETLEVSRFHGVGPATAAKMERLGIRTGKDLRERSLAFLTEHFGKAGAHFHAIARAEDHRPVVPDRPRKSAGSETTYPRDLEAPAEVEAAIQALTEEVWAWCERTGARGRTVTVKLRYSDFRTLTRSRSAVAAVGSLEALAGTAVALARALFPLEKPVRLLGVTVSGFGAGDTEADADHPSFDFERPIQTAQETTETR